MKKLFLSCYLLLPFYLAAQSPLDVNESTLKVGALSEEVLYYGFCEGDQLLFSFEEVNGKELKEVEIIEMPSSSKFMDFKTTNIATKTIQVQHTGIYKFRFYNGAVGGRICKFKIQRIPSSDAAKNFNTTVYWKTIFDTTYYEVPERYLAKSDTAVENVVDQVAKVHSFMNSEGDKTTFNFSLPANTVSWSYYVGVGQEGIQAFARATANLSKSAGPALLKMPGYGPLAALALGGASFLASIQSGENVNYYLVQGSVNANGFTAGTQYSYYKKANVINDFSKMDPIPGNLYFCFYNDNYSKGIDVTVKVTAITVTKTYATRQIRKMDVKTHLESYLKN
ncbi:MAG: hypothetical protein ABIQ40_12455 [Bacteroidia bacterium]